VGHWVMGFGVHRCSKDMGNRAFHEIGIYILFHFDSFFAVPSRLDFAM
jgi:hypothetical protein